MKLFLWARCQDNLDSYSVFIKSDAEEFSRTQTRDPLTLKKQSSPDLWRYFSGSTVSSPIILVLGNFRVLQVSQKIKSPVSQSFCSSIDVHTCPHLKRSNSIHSVFPSHPETLTALWVPFFPKATVIEPVDQVQCSINLSRLAPSRVVDLPLNDPLKSPASQRWPFSCC